jgi:hypothetical protein
VAASTAAGYGPPAAGFGFLVQYLQASLAHKWHLEDLKREAYAELLRSISVSYAQAFAGEGTSEDASILRAVTVIELLAKTNIADSARQLAIQVSRAHEVLRSEGYEAARDEIGQADHGRLELIRLFQPDLGIG